MQTTITSPVALQAYTTQSLLNVVSNYVDTIRATHLLTNDIHRNQEAANSRIAAACKKLREVEAQAPTNLRINPVIYRGKPFRQERTFSSGLFLRQNAPDEVNAFRARAEAKPDFSSLEKFRDCLRNPPERFTTSRPEYFLDCWLSEEEARLRREYKRARPTKRPRADEKVVVPKVVRYRVNKFGEREPVTVGEEMVLDVHSRTPSLSLSSEELTSATHSSTPTVSEEELVGSAVGQHIGRAAATTPPSVGAVGLPPRPRPRPTLHVKAELPSVGLPTRPRPRPTSHIEIAVERLPVPSNGLPLQPKKEATSPVQRPMAVGLFDAITDGPGITGLRQTERRKRPQRPMTILDGIKKRPVLNPVGPIVRKTADDYRPPLFRAIQNFNTSDMNHVKVTFIRPKPAVNPLFAKMQAMRAKIAPMEPHARSPSLSMSSACSDADWL